MDVFCANCGEPSEVYHVNHDMEPKYKKQFLAGTGCDCCKGVPVEKKSARADVAGALLDILGDALDGMASMMDDFDGLM